MSASTPAKRLLTYKKVEAQILEKIQGGAWTVGSMLPSRQGLANEFRVSMGTIERAVGSLIASGVLRADSRRGTYVAKRDDALKVHAVSPPSLDAPIARPAQTLGIIASYATDYVDSPEYLFYWIPQIVYSLASVYLQKAEATLMFNLWQATSLDGKWTPLLPLTTAADSLMAQGATSIAIIDIHNEIEEIELERFASRLDSYKVPIVHISSLQSDLPLPHVSLNCEQNGAQAARVYLEQGHPRMTFVGPENHAWARERLNSARQFLSRHHLGEDALSYEPIECPVRGANMPAAFSAAAAQRGRELFEDKGRALAIIAANDLVAYGIMDAGREAGLMAGRDYSIIGSDDSPKSLTYGLSTFRPPFERIGQEAAEMLKRMAITGRLLDYHLTFNSRLVVRSSTLLTAQS